MNELDKILKILRETEPPVEEGYIIREKIMDRINERRSIIDYFFIWTEIGWLRRSLTLASVAVIFFFGIQQVFVTKRIQSLEKSMVSINTDKILEYQRENVIANSVLFTKQDQNILTDSMKVATEDLLDLVKSYRDLQMKYEDMRRNLKTEEQGINKQKL